MKKLKNMKGITLIALVITIVVLLILAGVTIAMLTGDNGILTKAQTSKTKSAEEEARERVSLMLAEWKIDNATDGVTIQDYLESADGTKYYNQIQSQGIENITKSEEEGLYYAYVIIGGQDYYVEIHVGNAGKVTIGEILTSLNTIMFGVNMEPKYVFSGNVEVTITATAPDGKKITNIEIKQDDITPGDIVGSGTQTASRTFTLAADANNEKSYIFIATDNEGKTEEKPITIKTLPKPEIDVTQNGTGITINVTNSENYPEGTQFKYYVGDDDTTGTENSYTKTGLTLGETYNIRVKAYYKTEENKKESEDKAITLSYQLTEGDVILFNNGLIDGVNWDGWCAIGSESLGSGSTENGILSVETWGYCGYVMSTENKIDLSQFNKIVLKIETISGSPSNLSAFTELTNGSFNSGIIKDLANCKNGSYVEVDISQISDSRYLGITTAWSTKLEVSQVFLVK